MTVPLVRIDHDKEDKEMMILIVKSPRINLTSLHAHVSGCWPVSEPDELMKVIN